MRDLWFAMIGSLSIAYESQVLFLKHRLEQADAGERDDPLLDTLISSHLLNMDLFWRMFRRRGLDRDFLRRYVQVNTEALMHLAAEGRAAARTFAGFTRHVEPRDT